MNDKDWFSILGKQDSHNRRHFFSILSLFGIPPSYLDVGCGTGAMVRLATRLGIKSFGVDLISHPETNFIKHDLNEKFALGTYTKTSRVHLITCIEVAEHLRPDSDEILANSIDRCMLPGGRLIFSSAYPGQGGDEHISAHPAYHWRKLFHDRDFNYDEHRTNELVILWSHIRSPLMWLPANVQIFEKNRS